MTCYRLWDNLSTSRSEGFNNTDENKTYRKSLWMKFINHSGTLLITTSILKILTVNQEIISCFSITWSLLKCKFYANVNAANSNLQE